MSTTPNSGPDDPSPGVTSEARQALIRMQVVRRLGSPENLLGVDVRALWGKYYRVNVRVGADFTSAKVAASYFLTTDGKGNILESSPEIVQRE